MDVAGLPGSGSGRSGARILDIAEGVLLVLRGCSRDQAFAEIVQTAKTHNVSALSLAEALVTLAEFPYRDHVIDPAVVAARAAWGHLLDQARHTHSVSPPGHGEPEGLTRDTHALPG